MMPAIQKMHHKHHRKTIGLIVFLLLCMESQAQESDGAAGTFLKLGVGARPLGMGGAYVGLAEGPVSTYWNPAGLGFLTNPQFEFMMSRLPFDRSVNFVTGTLPVKGLFSVGLSWIGLNVGGVEARSGNSSEPDFVFSNNQNAFVLSAGRTITSFLSLGGNVKLIRSSLESTSATGWGFDVAVLLRPVEHLRLGLLLQDLATNYRWDSDLTESVPMSLRVGASYEVFSSVVFSADFVKTGGAQGRMSLGGELRPLATIPIRVGWNQKQFSGGAGLDVPLSRHALELNYAYAYDNVFNDAIHRVSLVFKLGAKSSGLPEISSPPPGPVKTSTRKNITNSDVPSRDRVVVTAELLNVRSGPGTEFEEITQVHLDEVFEVQGSASAWVKIRLPDGKSGWVHKNYLRKFR